MSRTLAQLQDMLKIESPTEAQAGAIVQLASKLADEAAAQQDEDFIDLAALAAPAVGANWVNIAPSVLSDETIAAANQGHEAAIVALKAKQKAAVMGGLKLVTAGASIAIIGGGSAAAYIPLIRQFITTITEAMG